MFKSEVYIQLKKPEQDAKCHPFKANQASKLEVGLVNQSSHNSSNVSSRDDNLPQHAGKSPSALAEIDGKASIRKDKSSVQMGASSSSEQVPGNISPPASSHSNGGNRSNNKRRDKKKERTIDVEKLPGYRGQEQLESLVEFINSGKGHVNQKGAANSDSSNGTTTSTAHNDAKETSEEGKTPERHATRRSKKGKPKIGPPHNTLGDGRGKSSEDAQMEEMDRTNITIPKQSQAIAVQGRLRSHRCSNRCTPDEDMVSTSLESNANDSSTGNSADADPTCECGGSESESQADLSGSTPASNTPPTSESLKTTSSSDKSLSSYESAVGDISGSSFVRDLYTYYDTEDASSEDCALADRGEFTPVVSKRGKRVNARNRDSDDASVNFADASDSIPSVVSKRPEKSFRVERASSSPPTTTPSSPTAAELSPAHFPALSRSSQEGFLAPSSADGRRNSTGNLNTSDSKNYHHSIKPYDEAQRPEIDGDPINHASLADASSKANLTTTIPPSYAKIAASKSLAVEKQEAIKTVSGIKDDRKTSENIEGGLMGMMGDTENENTAQNLLAPGITQLPVAEILNNHEQAVRNDEQKSGPNHYKDSDAKSKKSKECPSRNDSRNSLPQIEITNSPSHKKHNFVVFLNEKDNCADVNLDGITFGFDLQDSKFDKTLVEEKTTRVRPHPQSRSLSNKKPDGNEKKSTSPEKKNSRNNSTEQTVSSHDQPNFEINIPHRMLNNHVEPTISAANDGIFGQTTCQLSIAHNTPSHLPLLNHHNALHQSSNSIPPTRIVPEKTQNKPSYAKHNPTSDKPAKFVDAKSFPGNHTDQLRHKYNHKLNRGNSGDSPEKEFKGNFKGFSKKEERNSLDIIPNYRKTDGSLKFHNNNGIGSFNVSECTNFMSKEWMKFKSLVERDSTAVVWYENKDTPSKLSPERV